MRWRRFQASHLQLTTPRQVQELDYRQGSGVASALRRFGSQKLFQNRMAEEGLLRAAQNPRQPREPSAPQGLDMSSRGQRPISVYFSAKRRQQMPEGH